MKKKKQNPPAPPLPRTIKGSKKITIKGYNGKTSEQINEINAERECKRKEKEIQIVNIVGGCIGISTLIIAGLVYGWALTAILFFIIVANNLCNAK